MDKNLVITFIGIFIVIFLGHFFFITRPAILKMTGKKKIKKTKKKKKKKNLGEIEYLCNKFKLNRNKLNYKELMIMIPLIDSFIITFVTIVIDLVPGLFIFKLIIGFVLLMGLIYAIYEIYGRHLIKKEKEKE